MLNPFCWFGRCRLCWGEVVEEIVEWESPQLGPQLYGETPHKLRINYWYCTRCGLMYKFKPGKGHREKKEHKEKKNKGKKGSCD
jgi:hypothetical protein